MSSTGATSIFDVVMAAGLVDRVQVTLFPVITGSAAHRQRVDAAAPVERAYRAVATG